MFLKRSEKQFLYRKYVKEGMSEIDADKKIKSISEHLHNLVLKLRKKNLSEKDINKKFKEEFEKLCQRY